VNLWDVLHATLPLSLVSQETLEIKNIQYESEWCLWLLLPPSTEKSSLLMDLPFLIVVKPLYTSLIFEFFSLYHFDISLHQSHWWDKSTRWTLPNFNPLGTITLNHYISHLELWLHLIPLLTWLEIPPIRGLYMTRCLHSVSSELLQF